MSEKSLKATIKNGLRQANFIRTHHKTSENLRCGGKKKVEKRYFFPQQEISLPPLTDNDPRDIM